MVIPLNWTEILSKSNLEPPGYIEAAETAKAFQVEKKILQKKQEKDKQTRSGRKKARN